MGRLLARKDEQEDRYKASEGPTLEWTRNGVPQYAQINVATIASPVIAKPDTPSSRPNL